MNPALLLLLSLVLFAIAPVGLAQERTYDVVLRGESSWTARAGPAGALTSAFAQIASMSSALLQARPHW